MPRPKQQQKVPFEHVTGQLRTQLSGAMSATMVPMSLARLSDLLDEIDRLRSLLGEKLADLEGEPETVIPLLKTDQT